ncbi:MAG: YraN family protein [Firmicutes bacterium]|nr:YraN family protein [Bacillota bacterium]
MSNKTLGELGEEFALQYLKRCGYRIIERNFRCRCGEIDFIAREGKALVFIEVKTRRSLRFGTPEEAVTPAKQKKLRTVASYYLQRFSCDPLCRFDVLALTVTGRTIRPNLIKNAF